MRASPTDEAGTWSTLKGERLPQNAPRAEAVRGSGKEGKAEAPIRQGGE